MKQKTKIIATAGPACENYEVMKELITSGVTAIRANFSHGTGKDHVKKYDIARQVAKDLNVNISLILDTKGPEIRIGKIENDGQMILKNQELNLICGFEIFKTMIGDASKVAVSYDMHLNLKVGDIVLLDDGKLKTKVTKIDNNIVTVLTQNQHFLKTNKRINLPGIEFSIPFLDDKDKNDLLFGISYGVDIVAASFVNNKQNLQELRKFLDENGGQKIQICSKIESQTGIDNIDEIIEYSDSIMVARGDLGLEVNYYQVPQYQQMIIQKCNIAKKEVIVATQMLDSMEINPLPTRAEVTDVYWATTSGADTTMLSGETASGNFPSEAVKTMYEINNQANEDFFANEKQYFEYIWNILINSNDDSKWAYDIAKDVYDKKEDYVFCLVSDYNKLKTLSKYKLYANIIAIFDSPQMHNKIGILNNVFSIKDTENEFLEISQTNKITKKLYDIFNLENKNYQIIKL
ncbi:pyruvate kinase [Mycoplasma miroungirhinis]|uniref:Pyruvate kinase n=1 Tax=Mycoplasma miroungirhinis TaxID=754516 RepID=A0A6M4JC97_9MOLU|nr:pyruvate kinase [Mycoplasma miroungirhinis]QJR43888.1 pyruvate kinase [Mycoplasma miroungirhinis]